MSLDHFNRYKSRIIDDIQALNKAMQANNTASVDEARGYDEAGVFYILSKLLYSNQSRETLGFAAFSKAKSLVMKF